MKKQEKIYKMPTEKGGKITLTEEEMKAHQETLRKQKIFQKKEGEKAIADLEKELEESESEI